MIRTAVATVQERYSDAVFDISVEDGTVVSAVAKLRLAVVELLENAVRHSERPQATVRVTAHADDGQIALIIADDGPPIPDIEAQVLTGGDEMTDIYHSTGLGLWLVFWIVELSDGHIAVDTVADGGNRISVRLPTVRD